MAENSRKTQFYQVHKQTAKLTDFAGFQMPLYYKGIIPEHLAVRNSAGIFDISHMGRLLITGADTERFLNFVVTNDVSKLLPNEAQYSVMCTDKGGIIDDFVIYRMEAAKFMVVFNASNREKDSNWLIQNSKDFNIKIDQLSDEVAMLAVQGPNAAKILQKLATEDLSKIERFKCGNATIAKPDNAVKLWKAILETGKPFGIEPCGLGARDTVRLEAGLCLYGNDIDENTTPYEAGLGFVVKLQKDRFIGKDALQQQKTEGVKRKRVGIVLVEQGIPRAGFDLFNSETKKIGALTSGTFSPLLKQGVGMGYVETAQAQEANIVYVKIRDKMMKAKIASFPLYDAERYGYKRKLPA